MAEERNSNSSARRMSSRLQRRAPASIQITPVKEWNVAIPLLSPLIQSPKSEIPIFEVRIEATVGEKDKPSPSSLVIRKWQHPAAPFGFEPPEMPFVPFVCTGNLER